MIEKIFPYLIANPASLQSRLAKSSDGLVMSAPFFVWVEVALKDVLAASENYDEILLLPEYCYV